MNDLQLEAKEQRERERLVCGYARILAPAYRDKFDFSEPGHKEAFPVLVFNLAEGFADHELKRAGELEAKILARDMAFEAHLKEEAAKVTKKSAKEKAAE